MSDGHSAPGAGFIDLHRHLSELERRYEERHPDVPKICWCGWEIQPGQDHGMCYPGM